MKSTSCIATLFFLVCACTALTTKPVPAAEPAKGKAPRWPFLATEKLAEEQGRLIVSKVDPAKMEERWTIDFATAGRSTADVLSELGGRLGMKLDTSNVKGKVPAKVTADLQGKCLMEGLESIAAEANCHLEYPVAFGPWGPIMGTIKFEEGPRTTPVTYAGPLLVEVEGIDEFAPRGSGNLKLRVRGYGLHPAMFLALGTIDVMELGDVVNAEGQSVVNIEKQPTPGFSYDELDSNRFTYRAGRELWNLTRSVKSVSTSGRVTLAFPTKVAWGEMKNLKEGAKLNIAGDTMQLEAIEQGEPTGDGEPVVKTALAWNRGFAYEDAAIVARDKDGNVLDTYTKRWSTLAHMRAELEIVGKPASIVVKVLQESDVRPYDFELKDIPLAQSDKQPERIDPPKWEGDAPASVEFVLKKEGEDTKKFFRCTNHSDQPIHKIKVALSIFDAEGKQIDTDTSEADGGTDFSTDEPKVLVEPGQTAEARPGFLLLPKVYDKITCVAVEVQFVNGMSWKLPVEEPPAENAEEEDEMEEDAEEEMEGNGEDEDDERTDDDKEVLEGDGAVEN